jgi:hypothetical protein
MINFFMDYELESEGTFGVEDTARSWLYPGLEVDVGALFSGE